VLGRSPGPENGGGASPTGRQPDFSPTPRQPDSTREPGPAIPATPSARSAAGDLWSGFGSSQTPSLLAGGAPEAAGGGAGSPLAVGLGLMGVGLMALVGGFAMAETRRRRRAPVDADRASS